IEQAIIALRTATQLKPKLPEAHNNLGNALKEQGRIEQALASFRTAIQLKPDFAGAQSNLLYGLHFDGDYDAQKILAAHQEWGSQVEKSLSRQIQAKENNRMADRRLQIG